VQEEILEKHPESDVKVYAIWLSVLGGDNGSTWPDGALLDDRVTKFWDVDKLASKFFAKHEDFLGNVAWDIYYLYGADATWDDGPNPLISKGFTIIGQSETLLSDFEDIGAGDEFMSIKPCPSLGETAVTTRAG
jgi:hypothetical protein